MAPEYVRIALTCHTGPLRIMCFITKQQRHGNDPGWTREATPENITAEIAKSGQAADVVSWRIVSVNADDIAQFPTHSIYRDAWVDTGAKIEHDMVKVKAMTVERARHARTPQLDQLDRDWMRATGQNKKAEADAVEAKRQELRDLPATIAAEIDAMTAVEDVVAHCVLKNIPLE